MIVLPKLIALEMKLIKIIIKQTNLTKITESMINLKEKV
jgi:hypothetical protein